LKTPLLQAKNITKEVNSPEGVLTIVSDINLSVNKGQAISIVGPSGSGKTTLLAILAGLDLPSTGSVWLSDQEITSLDEDARAQIRGEKVGFVFQSFHLLPRLSAVDNVMLPLEIKGDKQAREKALKALTRVGLNKRASHLPNQLSGGEKQRVAIARAFVTRPAILFADEPTGNLDKASSQSVGELLFSINQESDTTLILVTHNTALSERCELVHQLDEGRIQ
jgi:putative ABC transport system ATP-binding protein